MAQVSGQSCGHAARTIPSRTRVWSRASMGGLSRVLAPAARLAWIGLTQRRRGAEKTASLCASASLPETCRSRRSRHGALRLRPGTVRFDAVFGTPLEVVVDADAELALQRLPRSGFEGDDVLDVVDPAVEHAVLGVSLHVCRVSLVLHGVHSCAASLRLCKRPVS